MKTSEILEILAEEGYRPALDGDGDIQFKHEGYNCLVMVDEDQKSYLRFALPNFWPIDSEKEREQAIHAAVITTKTIKAAKIILVEENVWSVVEMFLPSEEAIKPILDQILTVMVVAVGTFSEEMRKLSDVKIGA